MTTPKRVQRHRQADAARRRVRTTGVDRIGTRTRGPQPPARWAPKPTRRRTVAVGLFAVLLGALVYAVTGATWAAGAVGGAVATEVVYRRELAQVRRTDQPIRDPAPAARRTDDLEPIPEPTPVDLDKPPAPRTPPRPRRASAGDHASRCTASAPRFCRCPDGPNRKGKTAARKRTTTRRKT